MTIVQPDGTTTCRDAYTSIGDDATEYYKVCFEAVENPSEFFVVEVS